VCLNTSCDFRIPGVGMSVLGDAKEVVWPEDGVQLGIGVLMGTQLSHVSPKCSWLSYV